MLKNEHLKLRQKDVIKLTSTFVISKLFLRKFTQRKYVCCRSALEEKI